MKKLKKYFDLYKSKTLRGHIQQIMKELNCCYFEAMLHHIWKGKGWMAMQMAMYELGAKQDVLKRCETANISRKIIKKIEG